MYFPFLNEELRCKNPRILDITGELSLFSEGRPMFLGFVFDEDHFNHHFTQPRVGGACVAHSFCGNRLEP